LWKVGLNKRIVTIWTHNVGEELTEQAFRTVKIRPDKKNIPIAKPNGGQ